MAGPSKLVSEQDGMYAFHFCALKHFGVWDLVLPLDMEQAPEAAHVEGIQLLNVAAVSCPCFTCIQQGW